MTSSPRATFWITAVATFMVMLDVTIVNVAIPDITTSFHGATLGSLSWVLNGYVIMFASLLVPHGQFAERLGSRKLFLCGTATFMVASLAAAGAPSLAALIAARFVQGGAAAAMIPAALALLLAAYPAERWPVAIGLWGAVASVASAIGPLLGGVLVSAIDWRLIFLLNGPVGVLAVACGYRMLRESRERPVARQAAPDLLGAALLAATVGLIALGLVKSGDWGWTSGTVLGSFGAAIVCAALFAVRLARHASPLVEPALLRSRAFLSICGSSLFFGCAFYALLLCSVLFLTQVWHYSILTTGLAILPAPLIAAVVSVPGGKLAGRYSQRAIILAGSLVFLGALVWLAAVPGTKPDFLGAWLPGYLAIGAGVGLVFPSQTSAAALPVSPGRLATGLAMNITARQLGAALGIAVLVSIVGASGPVAARSTSLTGLRGGFVMCALGTLLVMLATWPWRPALRAATVSDRSTAETVRAGSPTDIEVGTVS